MAVGRVLLMGIFYYGVALKIISTKMVIDNDEL